MQHTITITLNYKDTLNYRRTYLYICTQRPATFDWSEITTFMCSDITNSM